MNIGNLDTMLGEIDGSIEAYEAFIGTLRQIRAQHSGAK